MPVHVYECGVCGQRFEKHRHFGGPHPDTCPDGHTGVHRVFSPPTIIFRGSGFYVTDNASKNGRSSQSAPKEKETPKPEKAKSVAKAKEADKI